MKEYLSLEIQKGVESKLFEDRVDIPMSTVLTTQCSSISHTDGLLVAKNLTITEVTPSQEQRSRPMLPSTKEESLSPKNNPELINRIFKPLIDNNLIKLKDINLVPLEIDLILPKIDIFDFLEDFVTKDPCQNLECINYLFLTMKIVNSPYNLNQEIDHFAQDLVKFFNFYYNLTNLDIFRPLVDLNLIKLWLKREISINELIDIYQYHRSPGEKYSQVLSNLYHDGLYSFHIQMPRPDRHWPPLLEKYLPRNISLIVHKPAEKLKGGLITWETLLLQNNRDLQLYFCDLISKSYDIPFEIDLHRTHSVNIISRDDAYVKKLSQNYKITTALTERSTTRIHSNGPSIMEPMDKRWILPKTLNKEMSGHLWYETLKYIPYNAIALICEDLQKFYLSTHYELNHSNSKFRICSEIKRKDGPIKIRSMRMEDLLHDKCFNHYLDYLQSTTKSYSLNDILSPLLDINEIKLWWLAASYKINLLNLPSNLLPPSYGKYINYSVSDIGLRKQFLRSIISLTIIRKNSTKNYVNNCRIWRRYYFDPLPKTVKINLGRIFSEDDKRVFFYSNQTLYSLLTNSSFKPPFTLLNAVCKYNQYRSLPIIIQSLLLSLYQTHGETSLMSIANLEERLTLDKLIFKHLQLDNSILNIEISQDIGMYIPTTIDDINSYIIENILSYQSVVERPAGLALPSLDHPHTLVPKYLSQFGDLEIMISLGVFFNYRSRRHLLEQVQQLLYKPTFFRPINSDNPLARFRPSTRYPILSNNETTLLSETNDSSLFIIGYGTLLQYRAYELHELNLSIKLEQLENEPHNLTANQLSSVNDNTIPVLNNTNIIDLILTSPRITPIFNPQTSNQLASITIENSPFGSSPGEYEIRNYNQSIRDQNLNLIFRQLGSRNLDGIELFQNDVSIDANQANHAYVDTQYNNSYLSFEPFQNINQYNLGNYIERRTSDNPMPTQPEIIPHSQDVVSINTNDDIMPHNINHFNSLLLSVVNNITETPYFNINGQQTQHIDQNATRYNSISFDRLQVNNRPYQYREQNYLNDSWPLDSDLSWSSNDSPQLVPEDLLSWNNDDDNLLTQIRFANKLPLIFPYLRRPEEPQREFNYDEALQLKDLLQSFFKTAYINNDDNNLIEELLNKITMAIDLKKQLNFHQDDLYREYVNFSQPIQDQVMTWLKIVFEAGMYMRRWKGPGHSYPLSTKQTLPASVEDQLCWSQDDRVARPRASVNIPSIQIPSQPGSDYSQAAVTTDPQMRAALVSRPVINISNNRYSEGICRVDDVLPLRSEINNQFSRLNSNENNELNDHEIKSAEKIELLNELIQTYSTELIQFLENLMAYNLHNGTLQRINRSLCQIIETIRTRASENDEACIRINSTILIGSSYFYTYFLTGRKIFDFDPYALDPIS